MAQSAKATTSPISNARTNGSEIKIQARLATFHRLKVPEAEFLLGREMVNGGPLAAVAILVLEEALGELGLGEELGDAGDLPVN